MYVTLQRVSTKPDEESLIGYKLAKDSRGRCSVYVTCRGMSTKPDEESLIVYVVSQQRILTDVTVGA